MKAIIKRAYEPVGRIREIDNTLESLQKTVGGYIEVVTLCTDLAIICDEEGRLKGLPRNCQICGADFVGTIVAVGVDGDEFCDCPLTLEDWEERWLTHA